MGSEWSGGQPELFAWVPYPHPEDRSDAALAEPEHAVFQMLRIENTPASRVVERGHPGRPVDRLMLDRPHGFTTKATVWPLCGLPDPRGRSGGMDSFN